MEKIKSVKALYEYFLYCQKHALSVSTCVLPKLSPPPTYLYVCYLKTAERIFMSVFNLLKCIKSTLIIIIKNPLYQWLTPHLLRFLVHFCSFITCNLIYLLNHRAHITGFIVRYGLHFYKSQA